jgi:hypothetical protein
MDKKLPDDIIEARKLLEKYEKSKDQDMRTNFFLEALERLKSYEDEYPQSPHGKLIGNLKKSYLRKLLKELPMVPAENIGEWYGYVQVILNLAQTFENILNEEPALKEDLVNFIEIYKDDYNRMVERAEKKKTTQTEKIQENGN